jgi:hypothetical protein
LWRFGENFKIYPVIQNVTGRENEGGLYYSPEYDEQIVHTLQGVLPIINYRIRF